MKRAVIIGGTVLIFLLNTMVFADAEEPVGLKYQLETGGQYRYQMAVRNKTVQQVREHRICRNEAWNIEYGMTTLSGSKNKSGILLRVTYNSIHHTFNSPFQQYSFQLTTDDVELPKVLQPYAALVGTDFNLKLQNRPQLLPQETPQVQNMNLQQLFTIYSPEAQVAINSFPNLVQNLFPVYAKNPKFHNIGAGWTEQICIANGRINPEVSVNYRIIDISGKDIGLEFETPAGWEFNRKDTYKNNRKVVAENIVKLAGTARGSFRINKLTGLPLQGLIKLKLAGELLKLGVRIPVSLETE
ncbi:MAG TPA: hypothetical protein VEC37_12985, partial [Bacillota bacterium]|nr:hypothetical protein [Bacillota bacterium]